MTFYSFAVETTTTYESTTPTTEDYLDSLFPDYFSTTTEYSTTSVDYDDLLNETTPGWESTSTEFYFSSPAPVGKKRNPCVSQTGVGPLSVFNCFAGFSLICQNLAQTLLRQSQHFSLYLLDKSENPVECLSFVLLSLLAPALRKPNLCEPVKKIMSKL